MSAGSAVARDGSRRRASAPLAQAEPTAFLQVWLARSGHGDKGANTCSFKSVSCGLQAFYDVGEARRD